MKYEKGNPTLFFFGRVVVEWWREHDQIKVQQSFCQGMNSENMFYQIFVFVFACTADGTSRPL